MNKNLITIALVLSLTACGGSSDPTPEPEPEPTPAPAPDPTPDPQPENIPATFAGDSQAVIDVSSAVINLAVIVADEDTGEDSIKVQTNVATSYGTFSISSSGEWSYEVDTTNSDIIALSSSTESVTDTIAIESFDGTASSIMVTISGIDAVNQPAQFSNLTGSMTNVDATTTGTVSLTDPDDTNAEFVAETKAGTFGSLTIDTQGAWTYTVDSANTDVVGLTYLTDKITDSITIMSDDSSTATIMIDITGSQTVAPVAGNDSVPDVVCTQTVDSIAALESAADDLVAGDTLCLDDGNYTGPLDLDVQGTGTADMPITVAAKNPGSAIISGGESKINIGGEYVVIQGLVLRDGTSGTIIQLKKSTECSYCRITEVSLIDMDSGDYDSSNWIEYYGQHNRIDHNYFSGKESRGVMLKLGRWTDGSVYPADYAQIDHNYFGDRAPAWGRGYAGSSDNEYEGIRLGLSTTHQDPSYSTVEYNYFERIQGEAEIISNKSANNTIRYNTIRDSNGSIVTRHGEGADISNNFIFGDDNPFAGGIRLVDGEHTVTNNYIEGARFLSSNWNGGIVLTSSDGSGDGENGYQDVENVLVAHNTIVDSVNSLNVFGGNENTAPSGVYLINNIIADAIGPVIRTNDESMPSGTIDGNYVYGQEFSDNDSLTAVAGMSFVDAELEKTADGLYRPSTNSPSLTAAVVDTGTFVLPTDDMDGQTRSASTTSGADEELSTSKTLRPLTAADVGPKNYTPAPGKIYVQKVAIANHDFDSGDLTGWTSTGAMITTATDEVFSRGSSLKINSSSANASQAVTLTANTNYTLSAFTKGTALLGVTLADGTKYSSETENSSYKFASVTFNSGTNTSATIVTSLPDTLPVKADIINADFGDKLEDWVVIENDDKTDGLGDVGDSSDAAVSGSRAAKFNYRYANDNNSTPGLYQDVTVKPNTDYNLSMYVLVKSSADGTTATFGIKDPADGSVIVNKVADYNALEAAGAPKGSYKDHYQDFISFNSGSATSVRVYAEMDAQTMDPSHIPSDPEVQMEDSDRKIYEIRVDDFELSYNDVPPAGSEAYFDSIRLVSHPLSEAESSAKENE